MISGSTTEEEKHGRKVVLNVNFGTQSLRMIIRQRISPMMHSLMLIITSAEMYTLTQMDLGAIQQIQIRLGKLVFQNYVVQIVTLLSTKKMTFLMLRFCYWTLTTIIKSP